LCIARNAPKILADLSNFKEHLREQGLQAFHLKAQGTLHSEAPPRVVSRVSQLLTGAGWRLKVDQRANGGAMIAARRGAANKLGYIAAHSAIVLICLGGLFDGDLIVKAQMMLQANRPTPAAACSATSGLPTASGRRRLPFVPICWSRKALARALR
jgi:cytochrome c biogenesis protein